MKWNNGKIKIQTISPLVAAGMYSLTVVAHQPSGRRDRPNIIFILADDLGYGDLGCYGQQHVKTPHIDRLAREGMRFTQHYAGCTVSAPSRSSLVTGLHTGHTPIRGNKGAFGGDYPLPAESHTIGEMLKSAGYATGCFGKWGLGAPATEGAPHRQGFDAFFGFNSQRLAHNYYPYYLWNGQDTVWLDGNKGKGKGQYAQDLIHQHATDFIRMHRNEPFFACLTYIIPHAELVNPDDSIAALYRGKFPETPYRGTDDGPAYKEGGYGSTSHPRADFAAMVTRLDAYVGDIYRLLKELGIDNNTVIFFSSDNGPHEEGGADPDFFNSSGPLRGVKRDLYEGGIRVPLIAWYPPGIAAASVSDHISAFWDMMPTFAELAGTKTPKNIDGISFVPTLFGKSGQKQHDFLYWEFHERGGRIAARKGKWKAVWLNVGNPEKTAVELYDLSKDMHEDHNVAAQYPDVLAEMGKIKDTRVPSEIWNFGMKNK
ncbi:MAG: arylsulfatase [Bacteroidales bacterium]|jgi:arylsulfatase A-like enzyme|nr:arylsulfatase [Bacteroidales bacterium]